MKKKEHGFSGSIGFVLAAAGSAVGVGNIWRFPYLCAKDGGGLFLLVYLVLVLTFGFVLLTTDVAIGRKTKLNALNAYGTLRKKWKFLGYLTFLVPTLIMTYYSVIGGWILKYLSAYVVSSGNEAAQDGYFTSFITAPVAPIVFMLIFLAFTAWVVYCGVEKGIERFSRIIMPGLLLLIIGISIFSLTLSHTDSDGTVRTGLQGLAIYLLPDFHGLTFGRFLNVLLDAMSQLFFSLSVSMGIMITFGSYMPKKADLEKSVTQVEIFDTGVAFLAGLMIVPAVFVFSNGDSSMLAKGPSLMFVMLPKVFDSMAFSSVIAAVFFILVLLAALTSSISLLETLVAVLMDKFHMKRGTACITMFIIALLLAVPSSLGFGAWSNITILGFDFLDFFDFISNSVLMPIAAFLTCLFVGYIIKPKVIVDEVESSGEFKRKSLFLIMVKYIAPICIVAILVFSVLEGLGFITV